MKAPNYILALAAILLPVGTDGQELSNFLARHEMSLENFIMTGFGEGWRHCDVFTETSIQHTDLARPQIVLKLENLLNLDLSPLLSSSTCILVSYHVFGNQSLASLIKLGWENLERKRIALVLKMGSGISLDMAADTKKLPFVVAAQLESGQEQFLCPVLGETKPRLSQNMCAQSYASYKNKVLRVGMTGRTPFFKSGQTGVDGVDIRLLNYLAAKFEFIPKLIHPYGWGDSLKLVCICTSYTCH